MLIYLSLLTKDLSLWLKEEIVSPILGYYWYQSNTTSISDLVKNHSILLLKERN